MVEVVIKAPVLPIYPQVRIIKGHRGSIKVPLVSPGFRYGVRL